MARNATLATSVAATTPSPSSSSSFPIMGWLRRNVAVIILLVGQATTVYVLVASHSRSLLRHDHPFLHDEHGASNGLGFGPPIIGERNVQGEPSSQRRLRHPTVEEPNHPELHDGGDVVAMARSHPWAIPPGQPPNLPRIEADNDPSTVDARGSYGGKGDGKHLGGFTEFDPQGVAPGVWSRMMTNLGVRSIMDVGCGRGISTRWFYEHRAKVLCVEGSHDAVTQSFVPSPNIVEHDYSRGPWWPIDTYDAAWSVEFLEHVSRQYMHNYMQTLRKAAVLFVTTSKRGGWHHVEIHADKWWIRKFHSYGFVYDDELTELVREWARKEHGGGGDDNNNNNNNSTRLLLLPNGDAPNPQHVFKSIKVFLNPSVASLPAHAHLFPEDGCLGDMRPVSERKEGEIRYVPRRCGTGFGNAGSMETPLPESFLPPSLDPAMHERWVEAIRAGISMTNKKKKQAASIHDVRGDVTDS